MIAFEKSVADWLSKLGSEQSAKDLLLLLGRPVIKALIPQEDDFLVVKLDGEGNIVWQKALGGSKNDWAYSIQQTRDGGYIVAGLTYSNDGDLSGNHGNYSKEIV